MQRFWLTIACAPIALALAAGEVEAKSLWKKIRQVATPVVSVVAPGAAVGIKIIQGDKPKDAVKAVAKDQVKAVTAPAEATIALDEKLEAKAKRVFGADAAKAIEILRMPQKFERRLQIQGVQTTAHVIETGRLGDVVGAPLAAALRQARDLYQGRAKPMPPAMRVLLARTYSPAELDRVRYVIDDNPGSLPGLINRLNDRSGDNFAVTVDAIIVFARPPRSDDVWFWGHEIRHTVQYAALGIDGFAARYVRKSRAMEAEADASGDKAARDAGLIAAGIRAKLRAAQ